MIPSIQDQCTLPSIYRRLIHVGKLEIPYYWKYVLAVILAYIFLE